MAVTDFAGEFSCSLDGKDRINIPSGVRKLFVPEAENTIVFTPGFENINLYAYPLNEWKRLTKKLRTLNPLDKRIRDFIRMFVGAAHIVTMDSQGRIKIPPRLLEKGQITKELLIIGSLNKFELWNPKVYEDYLQKEKISLSDLTEEISFTDMFFDKGE